MRADLPVGRVTLLLTDIEGSTRLIEELGETRYIQALEEHRRVLRNAFSAHGGVEVDTQGDAFLYGFADPGEALAAAADGQGALDRGPVRVRMGLHTGELQLTDEGYAGRELHRAARVASSGHGGQVVVSAATRALVNGELIELGEHRLKDFDDPVALFQLGSERFPPLKTISNTNLPRPASSFIGRTHERNDLLDLLRTGSRLVTLSGPGGSGKTRLAIDLASELVPTVKAGVFWVPLATLRSPELVVHTVAQTLGASNGLADHIGERELLLLLDNFEQVVDAAPELAELLESCPNLKILVTSRELLRIKGEVDYPVPPLAECEAVELFCERSRLDADETIAELCRCLDDLPLAVELAAARSHVLTPAQTLARLGQRLDLLKGGRDADPRQATLRATIEWSHDLLHDEEQELFARLAVFAGGCTLGAAEDVCRADLDQLQSLVDKSLLRHTGDRFWMLETIREFGAERLESLPESDAISEQHARWYLDLAQGDKDDQAGARAAERLALLDDELENLRRAIAWAATHDAALEVDLVTATRYFLGMRGHLREGLGYLRHALETARSSSLEETGLLLGAAQLSYDLGENTAAQQCSEQLLELGHAREDPRLTAIALFLLSQALRAQGETERAHALLLDAVEPARTADDGIVLMSLAHCLGETAFEADDLQTAQSHFQDELDRARDLPNPRSESIALASLGMVSLTLGDTDAAAAYLEDALRITIALRETVGVLETLVTLAEVVVRQGRLSRAARLLGASDALRAETAYSLDRMLQDQHARVMAAIGDDPALNAARSEGLAMTMDEAAAYALAE